MATVKVLKCIPEDRGNEYNDYKYPEWNGEPISIECPDWNPEPKCGGGFHGITKDVNDYNILIYGPIFQVMEVDDNPDNFVNIDDNKVKFHKGNIIYQGDDAYRALRMIFDNDKKMIKWNGITIKFIKGKYQTENLQLLAVKQHSDALQYCYNLSYKVMYKAVKNYSYAIRFIKPEDQTEELQLLAVKKYGNTLQHCYNPTYKVMYEAVKTNGYAIQYIKPEDQTEELQLLAVKQTSANIQYCHNPSEKVKEVHKKLLKKEEESYNKLWEW